MEFFFVVVKQFNCNVIIIAFHGLYETWIFVMSFFVVDRSIYMCFSCLFH